MKKKMVATRNGTLSLRVADTFATRFLGLMGQKRLPMNEGLLITPCNSIHMAFMRFSIDAVYLDKTGVVLKISKSVMPWIGFSICLGAHSVIELTAGAADRLGLSIGDELGVEFS